VNFECMLAMSSLAARVRRDVHDLIARIRLTRTAALDVLDRLDPNDDPGADRLTLSALVALIVALGLSAGMWLRWKYPPMQDFGHHVALAAVVADYGRPHSLYTALYDPIDPIAANSLMYEVAGHLGRLIGVTTAVRACLLFYLVAFPLTTLYALRVFGRSPWGAVLAVPLSYNMVFVAGFANMLFAVPFMILSIALFYRALDGPTWKRTLSAGITVTLLFLAHAHVFLWTGFLLFVMALSFLARDLAQREVSLRSRTRAVASRAIVAVSAVTPALFLFALWYRRTFEQGRGQGNISNPTAGWHDHFGAIFLGIGTSMDQLKACFDLFGGTLDVGFDDLLYLAVTIVVCIALARMHRFRRPPLLELAFGLTALSYFVLPNRLQGHDVLAQRQMAFSLWFLPAVVSPVPAHVTRVGRFVAVGLIVLVTGRMLHTWHRALVQFELDEVRGLEWVMQAAPPRQRLHYVKLDTDSAYFAWHPFGHVETVYMGDGLGQSADTPGILSTSPIRYKTGVEIHRITDHSQDWPDNMEIWQNFDLVLTRRWHPTPVQIAAAQRHGSLLRQMGDWELWRSNEATSVEAAPE
jgi:hypothetical protein